MAGYIEAADINPLLQLSADIAKGDGHVQFSLLMGALTILAKARGIEKKYLHRAVDVSWDFKDEDAARGAIKLYDQG